MMILNQSIPPKSLQQQTNSLSLKMIDNQQIAFHRRQPSFLADPQSISNRRIHLAVLSPVSSLTTLLSAKAPTNLSICWAGAKIEIQIVSYV
jgi:hypothetical protein